MIKDESPYHPFHTYIHNWSLQPLVITTPLMLYVLTLYISGGFYSLKSIFEKLFMAIFIYFARNLLRGNSRRNSFRILFWSLAWDSNPGFSSNKSLPTRPRRQMSCVNHLVLSGTTAK